MRTLLINGSIWTSFGQLTNALLIEDGRVLALGSDALSGGADQTIDLAGSFVMPAFADGHAHPLFAGRESQGPKVNSASRHPAFAPSLAISTTWEISRYAAGK